MTTAAEAGIDKIIDSLEQIYPGSTDDDTRSILVRTPFNCSTCFNREYGGFQCNCLVGETFDKCQGKYWWPFFRCMGGKLWNCTSKKIGYILEFICYEYCLYYCPCDRMRILTGQYEKLETWLPHLTEADKQFLGIHTRGVIEMPRKKKEAPAVQEVSQWPASCEVCRPIDGESDIVCGPECPHFEDKPAPIEAVFGVCRVCGCREGQQCDGGCYRVEPDLCSACVTFTCGRSQKYGDCPAEVGLECGRCQFIRWTAQPEAPAPLLKCNNPDGMCPGIQEPNGAECGVCPWLTTDTTPVQEAAVTDSPETVTETAQSVTNWPTSCKDCTLDTGCGRCPNCPEPYDDIPVKEAITWEKTTSDHWMMRGEQAEFCRRGNGGRCDHWIGPETCRRIDPPDQPCCHTGYAPAQEAPASTTGYELADIELLYPNPANPRQNFDPEALDKLTESIKQVGVLEPILCVRDDSGYIQPYGLRIVAGERRWRASVKALLHSVPVIVRELTADQEFEIMLTENIQRADLDPIEEAQAFAAATARGWKQETLAEKLGISQAQVANRLRLLKLPESIQENISREIMNPSQALMLVKVAHKPELIAKLSKKLAGIPVAASEEIIDTYLRNECYSTPLRSGVAWRSPKFDPDQEGCGKCPERVLIKTRDSKQQHPYCMDQQCWEKKQREAEAAEMQEKVKDALGEDAPAEILKLCNLTNYASLGGKIKPEDCEPCEHITPAINYANQVVTICRNPECLQQKFEKIREAEKQKEHEDARRWAAEKQQLIDAGYTTGAAMPLVFMAAKAIELSEEQNYHADSTIYEVVFKHFGWPAPTEEEADDEEKMTACLVKWLMTLSRPELMQAIFVAMLTPIDRDDEAYTLTLGAAAGEEAKSDEA
jgi:ParB/RepB/Spo0J family partition protein